MARAVRWLLALDAGILSQLALFGSDTVYSALLSISAVPTAWWTIGTYMFVHAWLAHLAFNMFTLWMFAPRPSRSGYRALSSSTCGGWAER
jgi:membrane associated rhomboid family serine protease